VKNEGVVFHPVIRSLNNGGQGLSVGIGGVYGVSLFYVPVSLMARRRRPKEAGADVEVRLLYVEGPEPKCNKIEEMRYEKAKSV